jgi:hypothetical protein
MRWYHNGHGQEDDYPTLVRFSQIVQLSFKGHIEVEGDEALPTLIDTFPMHTPLEMFGARAVSKGTILPIERVIDDGELMELHQRDWVYHMIEYLHNAGRKESKDALERELVYLDSVDTTLALSPNTYAYATPDGHTTRHHGHGWSQPFCVRQPKAAESLEFFMAEGGEFGVASSYIREDDILCQFRGCDIGVILRPQGDYYMLVSKAILAPGTAGSSVEFVSREGVLDEFTTDPLPNCVSKKETTIDVLFDPATLQDLTKPFKFTQKHAKREPLCVQESSFGWYEFINTGLPHYPVYQTVTVANSRFSNSMLRMPNLWNILAMVKQPFTWMQPLQRLVLLLKLFRSITEALTTGVRTFEVATLGTLQSILAPLQALQQAPKRRAVISTHKRIALAT